MEDGKAVTDLDALGKIRARMLDDLAGRQGYGWLDLSSKTDITTFGLVVPRDDGTVTLMPWFFIPRDNIRERGERDAALYEQWAHYGFIELTDGNVSDYDYLRKRINEIRHGAGGIRFQEIAYDDWNAGGLEQHLIEDGFTMVPTAQSIKSLSPGTKELLALTLSGRADHGGNPVLRYMADNLVVESDTNERVRPTKAKSTGRIDGIVGCVMGLDRVMRHEEQPDLAEDGALILELDL
jgi:phage terminase large subunit-like protein